MTTFLAWFSQILLMVLGIFLMIVILLQRGRGGGLAGAFGGMGGQSAFGTKAGDTFTKITIVIAIMWVVVSGGSGYFLRAAAEQKGKSFGDAAPAETEGAGAAGGMSPASTDVPARPEPSAEAGGKAEGTATPAPTAGAATGTDAAAEGEGEGEAGPSATTPADEPAGGTPNQN